MTTQNQKGFTLVEIAIVLVIIGLLLGGVLKGQELIENSKVKAAISDLNSVSVAYNSYFDRFQKVPGDDGPTATLTARGTAWTSVLGGDNDGTFEATAAQVFTGAGENGSFFQQVRAAGFLSGSAALTGAASMPTNKFGGLMGVAAAGVTGMVGNVVCLSRVPGKAARTMDVQLDDGQPNKGSFQATVGVAGANTAPGAAATAYSDDNIYSVCRNL